MTAVGAGIEVGFSEGGAKLDNQPLAREGRTWFEDEQGSLGIASLGKVG